MAAAAAALLTTLACGPLHAEITPWGSYIPKRHAPPVVFITGHDAVCPDPRSGETPFFNLTFGNFDKVVNDSGRVAMLFELCYVPNRPSLDTLARKFSELTRGLMYEGGEPVREVDIIAHNIGGLMIRSYIAKGLPGPGIRKAIFIGVPHFGTNVARFTDTDPQLRQSSFGSRWLFDLATWNQGHDDLRGADAISLTGTAGINREYGLTDSVVTVNSASLDFVAPNRTLNLPLCHTQGGIGALFLCDSAPGIATVRDAGHPTARIALAFLDAGPGNSSDDWRAVLQSDAPAAPTSGTAGILVEKRTAANEPEPIRSAVITTAGNRTIPLTINEEGLAYAPDLPAGPARLNIDGQQLAVEVKPGATLPVTAKPGPRITAVDPFPGPAWPLVLAPGMLVRISGTALTGATALDLAGQPLQLLSTAPDGSITAVLPDIAPSPAASLTVRTPAGQHTTTIVLDAVAPAFLRTPAGTAAAAEFFDDRRIVTLYLTGLGATRTDGPWQVHIVPPDVTVAGQTCAVLYSGRAPNLPGIDQINCALAAPAPPAAEVTVRAAAQSATARLP